MRVLIVEDNAFNAYCLRRLLESTHYFLNVTVAATSQMALAHLQNQCFDLMIIDGELSHESIDLNGPELTQIILEKNPGQHVIAWTDSPEMKEHFAQVFNQYHYGCNEYTLWSKAIHPEHIIKTLMFYFGNKMTGQHDTYCAGAKAEARA
jgi:CheY-like chemotaxis protein